MQNKMVVSVCMITYGHEAYLKQAIEGVLNQNTSFNFELILTNDCSPDHSDKVISQLIKSHEKGYLIKYFYQDKNLGMYSNFVFTLSKCQGKYIALCEGDDYWTDPLKLQKQVDFLELHPNFEVCFTNINIINDKGDLVKEQLINDNRKTTYKHSDLPIWAPTLTRVFKNRDFSNLPLAPGLDTLMLLYQAKFGEIKFINEVTGTYRLHNDGIYSSQSEVKKKEAIILTLFESLKFIGADLYPKYFGMIFKRLMDLKSLDKVLFKKHKIIAIEKYQSYRSGVSMVNRMKIKLGFLMIYLPLVSKSKRMKNLISKIINRVFNYGFTLK